MGSDNVYTTVCPGCTGQWNPCAKVNDGRIDDDSKSYGCANIIDRLLCAEVISVSKIKKKDYSH